MQNLIKLINYLKKQPLSIYTERYRWFILTFNASRWYYIFFLRILKAFTLFKCEILHLLKNNKK